MNVEKETTITTEEIDKYDEEMQEKIVLKMRIRRIVDDDILIDRIIKEVSTTTFCKLQDIKRENLEEYHDLMNAITVVDGTSFIEVPDVIEE